MYVSDRTYFDTFDGLLRASGLAAVWEQGELALRELDGERVRARSPLPKPVRPLFAWDLQPGGLSDALKTLIDVRALLPLIQIQSRERPLDVLDAQRKTVARLRVQQPAVGRRRLRPRVRTSPVRGYDAALARVSETLAAELGFEVAAERLLDEAVLLTGGRPGGRPAKIDLALSADERADAAAAKVLGALLEVIASNLDGAIKDLDTEFLHDLRVSVRRSRAVQRELRGVFPPEPLAHFRREFRWLQQVTGEVRDLDVYVLEFASMRQRVPAAVRGDLDPLLGVLEAKRAGARRRMLRALRSERTARLLAQWEALLSGLERMPADGRPDAARPIAALAGRRIAKVYARIVKLGDAIDPDSPAEEYHELRKQGKELRYLLELFGAPLYPGEVVRPLIKALKALQDVLGRHQDREIQVGTVRGMGAEVSAAQDGPAALMAMGMLVQRLEADQLAARAAFAERFAAFASKDRRRLVKGTFA
jgi:CHAD domain-containing protein